MAQTKQPGDEEAGRENTSLNKGDRKPEKRKQKRQKQEKTARKPRG